MALSGHSIQKLPFQDTPTGRIQECFRGRLQRVLFHDNLHDLVTVYNSIIILCSSN